MHSLSFKSKAHQVVSFKVNLVTTLLKDPCNLECSVFTLQYETICPFHFHQVLVKQIIIHINKQGNGHIIDN